MPNLPLKSRRLLARGFGRQHIGTIGRRTFRGIGNRATLTTALAGANNDLTLISKRTGTAGNAVTFAIVVDGNNTPLSVSVTSNAITLNAATNGSAASTTTAKQAVAALLASAPAQALVWAQLAPANEGSGVVVAQAATALSGGTATT